MDLIAGQAYRLERMLKPYWDAGHPKYGKPERIAAKYLGSLDGHRRWHLFEVWDDGSEQGVIMMNDDDLLRIDVTPLAGLDG